ncbi:MAG: hypothetical protein F4X05_06635 [Rhodothermaceae bacterium]|nr:hypothetical protein [Rhodothermaceae bacterium]
MIANDFYEDRLDLSARNMGSDNAWAQMPEVECVEAIRCDPRISARDVRLFLTFISAMDRVRDAVRLWSAGFDLFEAHPEVFNPIEASAMPFSVLRARLFDSGVSQRHGPDTEAWRSIAGSLARRSGSVCRVIDSGVGDAKELLRDLRSRDRMGRSRYPMLRGPKLAPMWVRIMSSPGGADIDRIDIIPVAVDVQVRRVTENLKVTDTQGLKLKKAKPEIQSAWHNAVSAARIGGPSGIKGTCAALDPALWFFGKYGCSHCENERQRVPIGLACNHCQLDFPIAAKGSRPGTSN